MNLDKVLDLFAQLDRELLVLIPDRYPEFSDRLSVLKVQIRKSLLQSLETSQDED
jgi:hypothetical protein